VFGDSMAPLLNAFLNTLDARIGIIY